MNKLDIMDLQRTTGENTFFQAHGTFTKIDHILSHCLNHKIQTVAS